MGASRWLQIFSRGIIGIAISGGLALMVFVVVYSDHGYMALKRSTLEEQHLIEAVKAGDQRNQALKQEIQRFQDDPQFIEKIAREDLGLINAKDIVIRLPESKPSATDHATPTR